MWLFTVAQESGGLKRYPLQKIDCSVYELNTHERARNKLWTGCWVILNDQLDSIIRASQYPLIVNTSGPAVTADRCFSIEMESLTKTQSET